MRRQRVDRALEAVEDMTATIPRHFHDLVVLVLAPLTASHIVLPGGRRPAAPPANAGASRARLSHSIRAVADGDDEADDQEGLGHERVLAERNLHPAARCP